MKKNKNKKTKIILLILVLCVTLGYAALRTGLNINGIASIPRVSWDVYFANYQKSASTNITPTTEPSTPVGTKPTTVSYAVTLANPGDLYEFTIDVVNGGMFAICDSSWVPLYLKSIYGVKYEQYCGSEIFKDIVSSRKYRMIFMGTQPM